MVVSKMLVRWRYIDSATVSFACACQDALCVRRIAAGQGRQIVDVDTQSNAAFHVQDLRSQHELHTMTDDSLAQRTTTDVLRSVSLTYGYFLYALTSEIILAKLYHFWSTESESFWIVTVGECLG